MKKALTNRDNVHIFVHILDCMITTTMSDFRKDMKAYLDQVTRDFETLIIHRGKDTGVVVISLEEYNALQATYHELSSERNQQRLDASIAQFKKGKGARRELLEE